MIKKQTIFITGASSGIGKATVEILENYKIFMVGRNSRELKNITNNITKYEKVIDYCTADINDYYDVEKAVNRCLEKFGNIDILINAAGLGKFAPIVDMNIDDWDRVIKTNLYGVFYATKLIAPIMIKNNRGNIINIGSDCSFQALCGCSAYAASKFGLRALTDISSKELLKNNIKVTFINPGAVNSNFLKDINEKKRRKLLSPRDVAEVISFIISRPENVVIDELNLYSIKAPYK